MSFDRDLCVKKLQELRKRVWRRGPFGKLMLLENQADIDEEVIDILLMCIDDALVETAYDMIWVNPDDKDLS